MSAFNISIRVDDQGGRSVIVPGEEGIAPLGKKDRPSEREKTGSAWVREVGTRTEEGEWKINAIRDIYELYDRLKVYESSLGYGQGGGVPGASGRAHDPNDPSTW